MTWITENSLLSRKDITYSSILFPNFPTSWTWPFLTIQNQGLKQTPILIFILKLLSCSQQSNARNDFYNSFYPFESSFQKISWFSRFFANITKGPVHLELFRPFASEVLAWCQIFHCSIHVKIWKHLSLSTVSKLAQVFQ